MFAADVNVSADGCLSLCDLLPMVYLASRPTTAVKDNHIRGEAWEGFFFKLDEIK